MAPAELGEALSAVRLCWPQAQHEMQLSLARLGQLTPVQVYRAGKGLEVFDGFKRVRAARELSWPTVRAEAHALDAAGAKVRLWRCNAGAGLSELEEAWLVRSLYREEELTQPQIGILLGRHKSWVCRRLTLAECLSDEVTANVRLGLMPATAAVEVGRLQRCNQDAVARVVTRRGMTTRQVARLVETLLAAPTEEWDGLLAQASQAAPSPPRSGGARRRTPAEQLVADASMRASSVDCAVRFTRWERPWTCDSERTELRMAADEKVVHDVVLLSKQGMSRRAISRALKVSRNTIREILDGHDAARTGEHSALPPPRAIVRPSKLDDFHRRSRASRRRRESRATSPSATGPSTSSTSPRSPRASCRPSATRCATAPASTSPSTSATTCMR